MRGRHDDFVFPYGLYGSADPLAGQFGKFYRQPSFFQVEFRYLRQILFGGTDDGQLVYVVEGDSVAAKPSGTLLFKYGSGQSYCGADEVLEQ